MADVPVRFAGLRGTLSAFAVDLFAGRVGSLTDAPMCSGGYDRWGVYDGSAWRLGPASDYAGNANVLSLLVNGTSVIDSSRNVKAATVYTGGGLRINALGDMTPRNMAASGEISAQSISVVGLIGGDATFAIKNHSMTLRAALLVDGTAETGGDSGSNVVLRVWNDAGTSSSVVLWASRVTGYPLNILRPIVAVSSIRQYASEPTQSSAYVKITDTTIGPSATAKASLLNGGMAAGGFGAATDSAGRWNFVGAHSVIMLEGKITTVANQIIALELYRNGASVATLTMPARSYGSATPWYLEIRQTVRTAGAAGTVRLDMRFRATADNASAQTSCYQMDSTLTGVDLTTASTWDIVATIPNNTGNSISCHQAAKAG